MCAYIYSICSEHIPLLHLYIVHTFIYALQRVHVLFLLLLRVLYPRTYAIMRMHLHVIRGFTCNLHLFVCVYYYNY
jgi:hypothetical protein